MPNPFDDNPFSDPSVQNVTQNTQLTQMTLEAYNPFAQNNTVYENPTPKDVSPATIAPTVVQPKTSNPSTQPSSVFKAEPTPPPPYSPSAAQNINIDAIRKQEEELARKSAELDRKEQALRDAEQGNVKIINNFPPLPKWFPIKPCFYQNINAEIPVNFQKWVRYLYYLWILHCIILFCNIFITFTIWMGASSASTYGFAQFALSLAYFVVFIPCSYFCWFRTAYKGFKNDSSFNFMAFFFIFFIQLIVNGVEAVGFTSTGFCGFWLAIEVSKTFSIGYIIVSWVMAFAFTVSLLLNLSIIIKIHRLYRTTGASFQAAQNEFASSVLSNKTVQNAAATAITETAKASVQNYTGNN